MWFIDIQTNDWLIDCWIDRMVNPAWFPIQFNSIQSDLIQFLFSCSYYPVILSSHCIQWTIPIQWGKTNVLFQSQWLYCIIYLFNNGFKYGIIIKYLSIRTIPLCHYQIQSSWLFEAFSFLSLLNNPRSILFNPSFGYYW